MKALYLREFREEDSETIKSFDKEGLSHFLDDPFTFKRIIIENEEGIILVGMRRVINEFKIITNNNCSNLDIARALNHAYYILLQDAIKRCPTEIYVFITRGGNHFINLLKKHMGFKEVKDSLKVEVL